MGRSAALARMIRRKRGGGEAEEEVVAVGRTSDRTMSPRTIAPRNFPEHLALPWRCDARPMHYCDKLVCLATCGAAKRGNFSGMGHENPGIGADISSSSYSRFERMSLVSPLRLASSDAGAHQSTHAVWIPQGTSASRYDLRKRRHANTLVVEDPQDPRWMPWQHPGLICSLGDAKISPSMTDTIIIPSIMRFCIFFSSHAALVSAWGLSSPSPKGLDGNCRDL
jgi:hypothetical protein